MKIVGTDIETTGIGEAHRIIEVAALTYDLASERVLNRMVERINPNRSIDAAAQRVHGISVADLAHCRTWEFVAPEFHKALSEADLIVAHNGKGFDMPFINREFVRIGLPAITIECFDTMLEGRWATPDGSVPNLGALCRAMGVDYATGTGRAHAADYDVTVMMDCFFRAHSWGVIPNLISQGETHALAA